MRAAWLLVLAVSCAPAARAGDAVDKATLKRIEAFGAKWWKARPRNKFKDWDPAVRAALLKEAASFGAIPEGSWKRVRDALWRSVKRYGPKGKGKGKVYIEDHGYKSRYTNDEMWALVKGGGGRKKGLILSLHGGGEGAGSADSGTWHLKGCMSIAPQGLLIHGDNWNRVHGEKQILSLIEIAKAQYDVDPDRVYVMGFSMGGTGSWHMAGRFPDLFAGAAPCNGVIMANPKSQIRNKEDIASIQYGLLPNVRNLAMYYHTGTEDKNCMPGTYLFAWDILEELRAEDPTGYAKIRFKCWPGLAHSFPPGEPSAGLKYLGEHRRETYPRKIVWVYAANPHPKPDAKDTTRRYPKHPFYWLRHDHPEDRMELVAERDGNLFSITSSAETRGLYLMLNPDMFDPAEPVVVKLEGEVFFRGRPEPDFVTVVESLDSKLDKSLTFDRKIPLWK